MGNTHCEPRKGSKQFVTVLQSDGRILEFPFSLRVADLLHDYHKHSLRQYSSAPVLLQRGKMLPPNATLVRGEVYFLVLQTKNEPQNQSLRTAENDSLLRSADQQPREEPGTIKFFLTKQQLARVLAEGSFKLEAKPTKVISSLPESNRTSRTTNNRVLYRRSPSFVKRRVSWSPGLDSISEFSVL